MQLILCHGKFIKVVCEDKDGFTFSFPYNQQCLDQYVRGFSLQPVTAATAAADDNIDFLLYLKNNNTTFGFINKGLFVELISAQSTIYDKLGRLMINEQQLKK